MRGNAAPARSPRGCASIRKPPSRAFATESSTDKGPDGRPGGRLFGHGAGRSDFARVDQRETGLSAMTVERRCRTDLNFDNPGNSFFPNSLTLRHVLERGRVQRPIERIRPCWIVDRGIGRLSLLSCPDDHLARLAVVPDVVGYGYDPAPVLVDAGDDGDAAEQVGAKFDVEFRIGRQDDSFRPLGISSIALLLPVSRSPATANLSNHSSRAIIVPNSIAPDPFGF